MNNPDRNWWTAQAGEFVLGTLQDDELAVFREILEHDKAVRQEVTYWEERLSELDAGHAVQPPEKVFRKIVKQLSEQASSQEAEQPQQAHQLMYKHQKKELNDLDILLEDPVPIELGSAANNSAANNVVHDEDNVARLSRERLRRHRRRSRTERQRFWPTVAGLAAAASLVLSLLLYRVTSLSAPSPLFVDGLAVVLSDEDSTPFFLIETDYESRQVRVTALQPPAVEQSQQLQLWQALPDRSAVRPVAVLLDEPGVSRTFTVDTLIEGSDLFGVSVEAIGANTSQGPIGPVVAHGDFVSVSAQPDAN